MCSDHPRVIKKLREKFEELLERVHQEVSDGDIQDIKKFKTLGIDQVRMFEECPRSDGYLKVFSAPTPAKKAHLIQAHLEQILQELRR